MIQEKLRLVTRYLTAPAKGRHLHLLFAISLYGLFLSWYYIFFDVTFFHGLNNHDSGDGYWQFLPFEVLRARPLESLLYLHSRPPLGNALLALGFQIGLGPRILILWNHLAAFVLVYYAIRFCFYASGERRIGYLLSVSFLYGISLNLLAYLSDMLYSLSTAALVTAFAWHAFILLHRPAPDRSARKWDLILAIVFGGLLSLQRSTYGLPLFTLIGVLIFLRLGLADALRFGLGVAAPVLLWSFKNLLVFGFFSSTTLFGMTIYFNAGQNMFLIERRTSPEWLAVTERIGQERPDLAPLLRGSMLKVSEYEKAGLQIEADESLAAVPALMRHEKDHWWGASNKNTYEYIQISRKFSEVSQLLIRYYPENYLLNVGYAAYQFMKPAWMYQQTVNPTWNTHPHLFEVYRLPHQDRWAAQTLRVNVSHGWDLFVYAFPVVLLVLTLLILRPATRGREAYILILLICAVATAGGLLFTHAENMRYKFEIEPLVRALYLGWIGYGIVYLTERFYLRQENRS